VRVNDGTYSYDKVFSITVSAYPVISSGFNDNEYLERIQFNTIDNTTTTETNGYGDYSHLSTSVSKGSGHTLSVTYHPYPGYPGENVVAWVDWNGNFDFDDTGERFDLILNDPNSVDNTVSQLITIPAGAVTGDVRMRVVQSWNDPDGADESGMNNGTLAYGEAEDYTINIQAGNTPPALGGSFTTNGAVNDNASIQPFTGVTVTDAEGNNVSMAITYTAANGTLSGTGLTGTAGNYTLTSVAPGTAQSRLRALLFTPTANQVAGGNTVDTFFTLTPNDGANGTANSTTKVTATSINDAPTDISLDSITVDENQGVNTSVGTLSTNDPDG
jgi:hypothetical protein